MLYTILVLFLDTSVSTNTSEINFTSGLTDQTTAKFEANQFNNITKPLVCASTDIYQPLALYIHQRVIYLNELVVWNVLYVN